MTVVEEILSYWFGDDLDDSLVLKKYSKLWFGKDEKVDREIKSRFEAKVACATEHGLLAGEEPAADRYLATILLLDQFPRNIYRGTGQAFASDSVAIELSLKALSLKLDQQPSIVRRVFFYLPFEHSEDICQQNRSVELFRRLFEAAPGAMKEACAEFLDYAVRHQEIIARFGRFPHRNAILGRESTPEELEFLQQPKSSF